MQQGDQYFLPFQCTDADGNAITPDNCYDFKMKVEGVGEKSYLADTLYPQTEEGEYTGYWLYPLTQSDTLKLKELTPIQAQVKYADGTILGTPVTKIQVGASIIRSTTWTEVE